MWSRKISLSGLVIAGCLLAGTGFAQNTNSGDISGIVSDSTGNAIVGATVTVLNVDTGVTKILKTNATGVYDTSSIVAGHYKLTFSSEGFSQLVRSELTIDVGNTTINAQLKVGSIKEEVVVTTDVPLLRTENGEQSTTLSAQTLEDLPQVGQDWSSFDILLPGAAGVPNGAQGTAGTGTSNGTMLAVNGNLPFSSVLADGALTTLPASANSDIDIQETIQEVQVSTSAFSAQYGVGGILYNQISKGGGDRFHGSVYEYFQNDALNADNYAFPGQKPTKSFLRYDNFGGSIGGPIIQRKLFFYFDFDKTIQHGGSSTTAYSIPTPGVMGGDFTGQPTIYDPATTTVFQQTGTFTFPGDTTPTACPCFSRTSFAAEYGNGNVIPASRIDPVAKAIQGYFPKSNATGTVSNGAVINNYTYTSPSSNPFTKYFGRLDYNISDKHRLTISQTEGDNPGQSFGAGICPIDCQTNDVSRENAQVTEVWTISPRMTNEVRLGYTNQLNFFVPLTLGQGYPAKLGFQFAKADNFPSINISGFNNGNSNGNTILSSQTNAVYKEHAFDPSDVVTLISGKHILHFGGEFLIYQNNSTAWGNLDAGTLSYSGAYTAGNTGSSTTGLGYADFLLGQTQKWTASQTPEYGGREKLPQFFVQDDYKLRSNLTLNLGVRYQIQSGWSEVKGNEASFDPTIQNMATATLGAMWYGSPHGGSIQAPVYTTVLPRVGFAYQYDTNTTVRGGFGLYSYNWSNDTYNGGVMGGAFGSRGNVSDQTNGITPVVTLSGSGSNLAYIAATNDPTGYNGQNVNYVAHKQPVGGSYQWNLQVQRQLNSNLVASLAYVASHGHNLPFPVDLNQVPENKLSANDKQFRPFPQFGNISTSGAMADENAISNYNSIQATIQQRLSHGLSYNFSYVWSHFLDDIDSAGWGSHSGNTNYQNAYDPSANYGSANFDIRNAFKGDFIYQLPFGRGAMFLNNNQLLDEVIGGWRLSSTVILQSGQPYTVLMGGADNSYSLAGNGYNWYPNVIGNAKLSNPGVNQWFNEANFSVPAAGTFGNERRNAYTGPDFNRVNLSLGKTFSIWEQVKLQVRADANNAFNHPSFGMPNTTLNACPSSGTLPTGCSAYGAIATGSSTITGVTSPSRTMQVSARLSF
jgi:hypothetical protein